MAGLPFLHLQMILGFSGPYALQACLDKTLLVEPGHIAADFIWQRPSGLNPGSHPISDGSVENKLTNRQFTECCAHRHVSHCHAMIKCISGAKINKGFFLRSVQKIVVGSSISLPPFPTYL